MVDGDVQEDWPSDALFYIVVAMLTFTSIVGTLWYYKEQLLVHRNREDDEEVVQFADLTQCPIPKEEGKDRKAESNRDDVKNFEEYEKHVEKQILFNIAIENANMRTDSRAESPEINDELTTTKEEYNELKTISYDFPTTCFDSSPEVVHHHNLAIVVETDESVISDNEEEVCTNNQEITMAMNSLNYEKTLVSYDETSSVKFAELIKYPQNRLELNKDEKSIGNLHAKEGSIQEHSQSNINGTSNEIIAEGESKAKDSIVNHEDSIGSIENSTKNLTLKIVIEDNIKYKDSPITESSNDEFIIRKTPSIDLQTDVIVNSDKEKINNKTSMVESKQEEHLQDQLLVLNDCKKNYHKNYENISGNAIHKNNILNKRTELFKETTPTFLECEVTRKTFNSTVAGETLYAKEDTLIGCNTSRDIEGDNGSLNSVIINDSSDDVNNSTSNGHPVVRQEMTDVISIQSIAKEYDAKHGLITEKHQYNNSAPLLNHSTQHTDEDSEENAYKRNDDIPTDFENVCESDITQPVVSNFKVMEIIPYPEQSKVTTAVSNANYSILKQGINPLKNFLNDNQIEHINGHLFDQCEGSTKYEKRTTRVISNLITFDHLCNDDINHHSSEVLTNKTKRMQIKNNDVNDDENNTRKEHYLIDDNLFQTTTRAIAETSTTTSRTTISTLTNISHYSIHTENNQQAATSHRSTDVEMGKVLGKIFDTDHFEEVPLERIHQLGGHVVISEDGEYAIIDIEGKRKEYKINKRKIKNSTKSVNKKLRDSKDLTELFDQLETLNVVDQNTNGISNNSSFQHHGSNFAGDNQNTNLFDLSKLAETLQKNNVKEVNIIEDNKRLAKEANVLIDNNNDIISDKSPALLEACNERNELIPPCIVNENGLNSDSCCSSGSNKAYEQRQNLNSIINKSQTDVDNTATEIPQGIIETKRTNIERNDTIDTRVLTNSLDIINDSKTIQQTTTLTEIDESNCEVIEQTTEKETPDLTLDNIFDNDLNCKKLIVVNNSLDDECFDNPNNEETVTTNVSTPNNLVVINEEKNISDHLSNHHKLSPTNDINQQDTNCKQHIRTEKYTTNNSYSNVTNELHQKSSRCDSTGIHSTSSTQQRSNSFSNLPSDVDNCTDFRINFRRSKSMDFTDQNTKKMLFSRPYSYHGSRIKETNLDELMQAIQASKRTTLHESTFSSPKFDSNEDRIPKTTDDNNNKNENQGKTNEEFVDLIIHNELNVSDEIAQYMEASETEIDQSSSDSFDSENENSETDILAELHPSNEQQHSLATAKPPSQTRNTEQRYVHHPHLRIHRFSDSFNDCLLSDAIEILWPKKKKVEADNSERYINGCRDSSPNNANGCRDNPPPNNQLSKVTPDNEERLEMCESNTEYTYDFIKDTLEFNENRTDNSENTTEGVKENTADVNLMEGENTTDVSLMEGENTTDVNLMEGKNTTDVNLMEGENMTDVNLMEGENTTDVSLMEGENTTDVNLMEGENTTDVNLMEGENMTDVSLMKGENTTDVSLMEDENMTDVSSREGESVTDVSSMESESAGSQEETLSKTQIPGKVNIFEEIIPSLELKVQNLPTDNLTVATTSHEEDINMKDRKTKDVDENEVNEEIFAADDSSCSSSVISLHKTYEPSCDETKDEEKQSGCKHFEEQQPYPTFFNNTQKHGLENNSVPTGETKEIYEEQQRNDDTFCCERNTVEMVASATAITTCDDEEEEEETTNAYTNQRYNLTTEESIVLQLEETLEEDQPTSHDFQCETINATPCDEEINNIDCMESSQDDSLQDALDVLNQTTDGDLQDAYLASGDLQNDDETFDVTFTSISEIGSSDDGEISDTSQQLTDMESTSQDLTYITSDHSSREMSNANDPSTMTFVTGADSTKTSDITDVTSPDLSLLIDGESLHGGSITNMNKIEDNEFQNLLTSTPRVVEIPCDINIVNNLCEESNVEESEESTTETIPNLDDILKQTTKFEISFETDSDSQENDLELPATVSPVNVNDANENPEGKSAKAFNNKLIIKSENDVSGDAVYPYVEGDCLDSSRSMKDAIVAQQVSPKRTFEELKPLRPYSDPNPTTVLRLQESSELKQRPNSIPNNPANDPSHPPQSSWLFSSDYKLSRNSRSLIQSIEDDMKVEALNELDPEPEQMEGALHELLSAKSKLKSVIRSDAQNADFVSSDKIEENNLPPVKYEPAKETPKQTVAYENIFELNNSTESMVLNEFLRNTSKYDNKQNEVGATLQSDPLTVQEPASSFIHEPDKTNRQQSNPTDSQKSALIPKKVRSTKEDQPTVRLSQSLHNIFAGDYQETDIDNVDETELQHVLTSPRLNDKSSKLLVTDVDNVFSPSSTPIKTKPPPPSRPEKGKQRKFIIVSKTDRRVSFRHKENNDDAPSVIRRSSSWGQKLSRPMSVNLHNKEVRKQTKKDVRQSNIFEVSTSEIPVETDLDSLEKVDDNLDKEKYVTYECHTKSVNTIIEDSLNPNNESNIAATGNQPSIDKFKQLDKSSLLLFPYKDSEITLATDELFDTVAHKNINTEIAIKQEENKECEQPTSILPSMSDDVDVNVARWVSSTVSEEDIVKATTSEILQEAPHMPSQRNINSSDAAVIKGPQHDIPANDNLLETVDNVTSNSNAVDAVVCTSLNVYHVTKSEEQIPDKKIMVTIPDRIAREMSNATPHDMRKDVADNNNNIMEDQNAILSTTNNKNKINSKKIRDSWDILEKPESITTPKGTKKNIEKGVIIRNNSKDSPSAKHKSWNILDLKTSCNNFHLETFINSLADLPEKKRDSDETIEIEQLFQQYQKEREALRQLREMPLGYSNMRDSISDFSEISSISDDLNSLRGSWYQDVSEIDEPELSHNKALELSPRSAFALVKTNVSQGNQGNQSPRIHDTDDSIISTSTIFTTSAQIPEAVTFQANTQSNENNGSKQEIAEIKPLPSPTKPDFVPKIGSFNEEDLGNMVMAQAVSAVRKRRGGRGRRALNNESLAPTSDVNHPLESGALATTAKSTKTESEQSSKPSESSDTKAVELQQERDISKVHEATTQHTEQTSETTDNMSSSPNVSSSPKVPRSIIGMRPSESPRLKRSKQTWSIYEADEKEKPTKATKNNSSVAKVKKRPGRAATFSSKSTTKPVIPSRTSFSPEPEMDESKLQSNIVLRNSSLQQPNIRSYDYVNSMPNLHIKSRMSLSSEMPFSYESEDYQSETSLASGLDSCLEGSIMDEQMFLYPSMHNPNKQNKNKPLGEDFSDSSGDESFTTEQSHRFNQLTSRNTERTVSCGNPPCSRHQRIVGQEKSQFISCNSCFTCYCSKTCKRMHWKEHRKTCFFGRVGVYIKALIRKCERDTRLNADLRHLSLHNHQIKGKGYLLLAFESPSKAKSVTLADGNGLQTTPSYYTIDSIIRKDKKTKHSRILRQNIMDYDPEQEFVINISIKIGQTNTKDAKKRISNVVRCARISMQSRANSPAGKSLSSYYIRTFCLPKMSTVEHMNDTEVRRYYCKELSYSLKRCGVGLKADYPEAYEKLCSYVEDEKPFLPIVLYGQRSGKNFKCILHQGKYNPTEEARGEGVLV